MHSSIWNIVKAKIFNSVKDLYHWGSLIICLLWPFWRLLKLLKWKSLPMTTSITGSYNIDFRWAKVWNLWKIRIQKQTSTSIPVLIPYKIYEKLEYQSKHQPPFQASFPTINLAQDHTCIWANRSKGSPKVNIKIFQTTTLFYLSQDPISS